MNRFAPRFTTLFAGILAMSSPAIAGNGDLLGVTSADPLISFTAGGVGQGAAYNGTQLVITSTPVFVTFTPTGSPEFITGGGLTLTATINAAGTFSGGSFTISGTVDNPAFGSPLLTGTVSDYGIIDIGDAGGTDLADFRLTATGGSLLALMGGSGAEIAMTVALEGSSFAGSFNSNWSSDGAKGNVSVAGPPPDTTPDPFFFIDQAGVPLSAPITSGAVTIRGINTSALIAVSGDASSEYSIGCTEPYTADVGFVIDGAIVCVRQTSASALSTPVNTRLTVGGTSGDPTVGGVSDTFTSTTSAVAPPPDTVPDQFTFAGEIGQQLNTLVTSGPALITGLTGPAPISVYGDGASKYSIGCSTYTNAPLQVSNGDQVCVQNTTAGTPATQFNTFLNVGGVVGVFSTITLLLDPVVVNDAAPAPTPAVDPSVILFNKTNPDTANTGQSIGIEEDGVITGGPASIGFCVAADPRESAGPGGTYQARPLVLSELAGSCPSLATETLVVPAYIRAFPNAAGVPQFLIATAATTADLDGMLLSQAFPEDFIDFPGGTPPPCNAPLSERKLWLWGTRSGEDTTPALAGEDQVMQPTAIQCNASRSGTKRLSNFISTVRLDETLFSSESFVAGQVQTLDKTLARLAVDDDRCGASLRALTTSLLAEAAVCRTAPVLATVTRDLSVPERRITRTLYEYTLKVTLTNPGGQADSASVKLTSGQPTTQVVGGPLTLNFGTIAAGATTAPQTFKIRQDRTVSVDPGVILPAVRFVPAASDPARFPTARAACERVAVLAKNGRGAFNSCPADIQAKKYRGALISDGLGTAFTIFDRLEHPLSGATWRIYPLPPTVVDPGQIPPE